MRFSDAQKADVMENGFGCLLQMPDTKMNRDFRALVVSSFNPRLSRLKVDGTRCILTKHST